MSVLFDRLCTLAAADDVLVLLALDLEGPGDFDIAELLTRAAATPALDLWLVTSPRPRHHHASERPHDDAADPACHRSVDDALSSLADGEARSVRVRAGCVSTRDDVPALRPASGSCGPLLFVAADRPGWEEPLAAAADRGIAFSVGAIEPSANFHVPSPDGVLAALDALVDLRCAADRQPPASAGRAAV